ncbi:Transport and Golgi organization protein 2 [Sesbania bispinosa]|nr:Transport and Golgi organization protein 2 [Sesbania bispinosa]
MCIAVFMWQAHPKYPFLLLLNRDEFHSRPTEPLAWWAGETILGGRDGLGGGTWLGSTKDGRVAFLTNFRELENLPHPNTRGDLPLRFLQSNQSPQEFAEQVLKEAHQYNGFNLILADICTSSMVYVFNRPKLNLLSVTPGIHVLTNAALDAPWPKGRYGTRSSSAIFVKSNKEVTFYEKHLDQEQWKEKMVTYEIIEA